MSVVTDAQVADLLKGCEEGLREKEVTFAPAGGQVVIREMDGVLQIRVAHGRQGDASREAAVLAACVFKIDHRTNERTPFATAKQWDRLMKKHREDTVLLLSAIVELDNAAEDDAKKN